MSVWKWLVLLLMASAPALAAAKKPIVEFNISVDGARLLIDGKVRLAEAGRRERLPITEGTHTVRVEHEGFAPIEQTFDVDADSPGPLVVRLTFAPGKNAPAKAAEPEPAAEKEPTAPKAVPAPKTAALPKPTTPLKTPKEPAEPGSTKPSKVASGKPLPPAKPKPFPPQKPSVAPVPFAASSISSTPSSPGALPSLSMPLLPPPSAPRDRTPPIVVAVVDYSGFESDARVAVVMSDSIAAEIRKYDRVTAIGSKDIRKVLSKEQVFALGDCQTDRCRAVIMASMGVDEILISELKEDKENEKVVMRRVAVPGGATVAVASKVIDTAPLAAFDAIGPDIQTLYGDYPLRPGKTVGVTRPLVLARLRPAPPLPTSVFISTASVGVAARLVVGVLALEYSTAQTQYRNYVNHSDQSPVLGATVNSMAARVQTDATVTNAMLIAGGALTLASVVEIFFTDWKGIAQQVAPPVMQDASPDEPVSFHFAPTGVQVSWR